MFADHDFKIFINRNPELAYQQRLVDDELFPKSRELATNPAQTRFSKSPFLSGAINRLFPIDGMEMGHLDYKK